MSRRRVSASPELSWRQDQALNSTLRIVRELGPTAFVLQEDEGQQRRAAEHRVSLGNPHLCSCSVFMKEKDLCKHICWLLLKKFKLSRDHEYALQTGLLEGEISCLLQRPHAVPQVKELVHSVTEIQTVDDGYINQKSIDNEDICPICQDKLLKKMLPVTYCRFGCGNNVHIVCMKIWTDHQKELERDSLVKCPLCRENFAPLKLILEEFRNCKRLVTVAEKQRLDRHLGIPCNNCRVLPIEGNCYRCTECNEYHLCHRCFRSFCHPSHTFAFREKRNQRWKSVEPAVQLSTSDENLQNINPEEKSKEEEYQQQLSCCIPEHILTSLPSMVVRKCSPLLDPGLQCRLCLKLFCLGQVARFLPCDHKFHRKCIDRWLHKENTCPLDGYIVYNPLTWENAANQGKNQLGSQTKKNRAKQAELDLFIPGIGLSTMQVKPHHAEASQSSLHADCNKKKSPSESEQNLTQNGFSYTCARGSGLSLLIAPRTKHLKFSRYIKGLVLTPKARADYL